MLHVYVMTKVKGYMKNNQLFTRRISNKQKEKIKTFWVFNIHIPLFWGHAVICVYTSVHQQKTHKALKIKKNVIENMTEYRHKLYKKLAEKISSWHLRIPSSFLLLLLNNIISLLVDYPCKIFYFNNILFYWNMSLVPFRSYCK